MTHNDLKDIDLEIAYFYAPFVLGSIKHGENRVCIWFPGSGKASTINSLLSSKTVLKNNLGGLHDRIVFITFSGHDSENALCSEVLEQINLKFKPDTYNKTGIISTNDIINKCKKVIDKGKEIVFIGDEIENLPQQEYTKLLNNLLRIVLTSRARIHTIINIKNEDMFNKAILTNNSILTIASKIQHVPILSGDLLHGLITKFINVFEKKISEKEIARIKKYSGGISILTKELIRNYPDEGQINLKFHECLKHISKESLGNILYFKRFGAEKLSIFNDKKHLADNNPEKNFVSIANENELKIYNFLNKNKNKLITKEEIAGVIWGSEEDCDCSDWAIDQTISRFRKKMIKAEIDPERLKTIKGKGYKWNI